MKFKVGEKVFVKPFEEIREEPNSIVRESDGAIMAECYVETDEGIVKTDDQFLPDMKKHCEKQYTIKRITDSHKYAFEESCFNFLECWLTDELRHYVDSFGKE